MDLDCRDDVIIRFSHIVFCLLSYSSTNKAFQVTKDPPCLKPFLNGKHKLLASVNIFPCPKPCVQTRIHPVDLKSLDSVVQCLFNLLQSAVTELVDLIEPHDHLNPIFVLKVTDLGDSIIVKSCLYSKQSHPSRLVSF
ncbi:hypothetical protein Tco_0091069 [Tanacetum coccineum]